jgi:predicted dehydrogenase
MSKSKAPTRSASKKPKPAPAVRVAIIGTGGMAGVHAQKYQTIKGCRLVAGCDVDAGRARAFSEKYGMPHSFGSLEDLLQWGEFDAVSIVTPDAYHGSTSIACLQAGKHVLCEKPLALDYTEAKKMVAAAKKAGTINMVNFSYRDWPALQAVAKVIGKGKIGDIRHVEASYLQAWLASKVWGDWRTNPTWLWRLSSKHGSKGVLGDVGVHILDFATFPAGPLKEVTCRLKAFPKAPRNRVGEYVLDANDSAVMTVEFANGALGSIHTSRWVAGHTNRLFLKISGTKGTVEIDSDRSTSEYRICAGADLDKATWQTVKAPASPNNYQRFIKAIRTGQQDQPDFARGAEVQKVLDACFVASKQGKSQRL